MLSTSGIRTAWPHHKAKTIASPATMRKYASEPVRSAGDSGFEVAGRVSAAAGRRSASFPHAAVSTLVIFSEAMDSIRAIPCTGRARLLFEAQDLLNVLEISWGARLQCSGFK